MVPRRGEMAEQREESTTWFTRMRARRHKRWVYLLPAVHLCACSASRIGFVIPRLEYWGIAWTFIMVADFPVSIVAYMFAFRSGAFATAWILIVGTLWWYLLGRGIEFLINDVE
jgi:hypothetical protein